MIHEGPCPRESSGLGIPERPDQPLGVVAAHGHEDHVVEPPERDKLVAEILRRRVPRIVYVSCDVATLARDTRALVAGGCRLERLRLVDLTPQTHRAELVATFAGVG